MVKNDGGNSCVAEFATAIEDNLRATDYKIHWRRRSLPYLGKALMNKVNLYIKADHPYQVANACVELGKLCMMVRDKILNPEAEAPHNGGGNSM